MDFFRKHVFHILVVFLVLAWPLLIAQVIIGGGMPTGSMVLSDGACPPGTSEVTAAQGRYIVATPSGGTQGGTVGSAMTDLSTTGSNLVAVSIPSTALTIAQLPSHTHGQSAHNTAPLRPAGSVGTSSTEESTSSLLGSTAVVNTAATGSGSAHGHGSLDPDGTGHVVPYIQLRLCEK